jgi:hypothetical protein
MARHRPDPEVLAQFISFVAPGLSAIRKWIDIARS